MSPFRMVKDDEPDLSVRQISILLTIYLEAPPHTVRDLARKLDVSKPVITRALDSMGKMELVTQAARRQGPAQCADPENGKGRALS